MKKLSVTMSRTEVILGLILLAAQLLVLPALLMIVNRLLGDPLNEVQINFAFFCLEFLLTVALFHRFLLESVKHSLAEPFRTLRFAGLGLLLYWLGSTAMGMLILRLYPNFANVNDASIGALTQENQILMTIGTVFFVPVVEETLYRGVIFGALSKYNFLLGYVISIISFSALHIVGYIGLYDPMLLFMCFLQYIPAGICLCWAYRKADSIWAPILMHITINQVGILSMR